MRLKTITRRRRLARWLKATPPTDVTMTLTYRPELFGRRFTTWLLDVMRGPSPWTIEDRELFAAFVSRRNECSYCSRAHAAAAAASLPGDLVSAALDDWRTAPLDEKLRAVLGFLSKLTLVPGDVGAGDIEELRKAGVSDRAIEEAINLCALFNIVNRLADALGFEWREEAGGIRSWLRGIGKERR